MGEFAAVVALPHVGVGVQGHHRQVRVAGLHGLEQGHGDGVFAPQGADSLPWEIKGWTTRLIFSTMA